MPAAGNETMYVTNSTTQETLSTIGGLAVGVPGEMRGWELLYRRHGKLPWKRLFEPAIHLARNGFTVNVDLANALSACESYISRQIFCEGIEVGTDGGFIPADPLWSEVYAPNGTLLKEGDTVYRKVDLNYAPNYAAY